MFQTCWFFIFLKTSRNQHVEIRIRARYICFDTCNVLVLVYENLGQLSAIRCSESIDKFSKTLQTAITKGKYPSLNPVIDEIYKYKTDLNAGLDSFVLFIENNSKFDSIPIDNKNSFIEITTPIEIMWSNIGPILEDDSLKIVEASIQTPFFRKEI